MPEKPKIEPRRDEGVELETQFILRLPEEPARVLREAVREGANNLKDRLSIRLDSDIRYGEVRFDHWFMHAKVVDVPTIIESLKSVDLKSFYKTADICQMMICKEEPDVEKSEDESPNKNKKKDPNKVDKKFLWPHGITPPLKNVRRRRFRKTLKKKYVEAPEIEKEVKRLLRVDNEAVNVKWEVINEEEGPNKQDADIKLGAKGKAGKRQQRSAQSNLDIPGTSRDVAEHDIFGSAVSDSDEDDTNLNMLDIDENSRLSADDSRMSDSNSMQVYRRGGSTDKMETEFTQGMFSGNSKLDSTETSMDQPSTSGYYARGDEYSEVAISREMINSKISDLEQQLNELRGQKAQKELEISSIENQTLRQRLQDNLDNLLNQIVDKELEVQQLQSILF